MALTRQTCVAASSLIPTCGRFPGVRRERRIVLDLVGQDGRAVVTHRLPDNRRVLGLALDPSETRRIRNILEMQKSHCILFVESILASLFVLFRQLKELFC